MYLLKGCAHRSGSKKFHGLGRGRERWGEGSKLHKQRAVGLGGCPCGWGPPALQQPAPGLSLPPPRDPPPQVSRVGTQTCSRPAPLQVCSALGAPQGALGWCPPRRRRLPVLEAGNDLCPSGGLGNWFLNIPLPLADSQADSSRRQRG